MSSDNASSELLALPSGDTLNRHYFMMSYLQSSHNESDEIMISGVADSTISGNNSK